MCWKFQVHRQRERPLWLKHAYCQKLLNFKLTKYRLVFIKKNSSQKHITKVQRKILSTWKKIEDQHSMINKLESKVAIQDNIIERVLVKSDDNEQHLRRNCLRIHGIAEDKDHYQVVNKIEECYKLVDLPFNKELYIDRAHRVGKSCLDRSNGKSVKSIIIKYKGWNDRRKFYLNRPKKKPCRNFSVSVDLKPNLHRAIFGRSSAIAGSRNEFYSQALNQRLEFWSLATENCSVEIRLY